MHNQKRAVPGQCLPGQKMVPVEPWMDLEYESGLRLEARKSRLPLQLLRRIDLVLGNSPYKGLFRENGAPAEYFGNVTEAVL